MSRAASRSLLALLLLAPGAATPAPAQSLPPHDLADSGPLDSKALARERRAADRAEPRELKRALAGAARDEHAVRMPRILGGVEVPDTALAELPRRLKADLALADDGTGRLAALERYWAGTRRVEELTRQRVEAGTKNYTPADYLAARAQRLLAERRLALALADSGTPLPGAPDDLSPFAEDDSDPFTAKAVALAKRAAARASPRALARAALDTTVQEYGVRIPRIMGGVDTPDVLLLASIRHVEAGRAWAESPAALLPFLESHWQMTWEIEEMVRERIERGTKNFTPADYADARHWRLEAETWLAEARHQEEKPLPLKGGLQSPLWEGGDFLDGSAVVRAKFAAARGDPRHLLKERRDALRYEFVVLMQSVRGGVGWPYFTSEVLRRLVAVDLALANRRAERLAALEAYWARARELEDLTREGIEAGTRNFTQADYYEARFNRLQAELWLIEARTAKE